MLPDWIARYVSPAAHDMATYRAIQSGSIPTAQLFLARGFTFAAALDACNRITVLSSREDMRRYLYGMRVASAD